MRLFRNAANRKVNLRWRPSSGTRASLESDSSSHLAGKMCLDGAAGYLVLGKVPRKYSEIERACGIIVSHREIHEFTMEISADDGADWTFLLMEYDLSGKRVGISRYRKSGIIRYHRKSGVERILLAVRGEGEGTVSINELRWRRISEIFERDRHDPGRRSFVTSDGSREDVLILKNRLLSKPFTMTPSGQVKICAFDLEPGRYELELELADPNRLVEETGSPLESHISLERPLGPDLVLPEPLVGGAATDASDLGFLAPQERSVNHQNLIEFTVLDAQQWVAIDLRLRTDREVSFDGAKLRDYSPSPARSGDRRAIGHLLDAFVGNLARPWEITSIVFADVDLNSFDGSSIWIPSLLSTITNRDRCIVLSKHDFGNDFLLSNTSKPDSLKLIQPSDIGCSVPFSPAQAVELIRMLDDRLPSLRKVVVHGYDACKELFSDRRFKGRGFAYLTDFLEHDENEILPPGREAAIIRAAAPLAAAFLVQTEEIGAALRDIAGREIKTCKLPPPVGLDRSTRPPYESSPDTCLNGERTIETRILFSGHDFKFVEPYASFLKVSGVQVQFDQWGWGGAIDPERSCKSALWADIIFCEWGLANAAWHSRNLPKETRLFVRVHAQEIRGKARQLAAEIDPTRVERFIFVSDHIRRRAIDLFGWPEEKTAVIPNFLLDDEYQLLSRRNNSLVHLGLVGMVPSSKRFDRALDLASVLAQRGYEVRLMIKGRRPEEMPHMFARDRILEMKTYARQYHRMQHEDLLRGRIEFESWGNDVAAWYGNVDYILSPSERESFHYALADGVLTGCLPIVWPWDGATTVYPEEWVVDDVSAAANRVAEYLSLTAKERAQLRETNREWLVERYGRADVYKALNATIGVEI